jgi:uncharacterized protein involved in exopolysaccharide biosynthesis
VANTSINNGATLEGPSGSSLSLRDIVVTLYRRKWVILAIALPIILVGGLAIFSQSSSYLATARVLVELTNVDQPRWNVTRNYIDYDRELSTMFNIAMSISVAELAAEILEDSIPVIQNLDPVFQEIHTQDDLTALLMGSTTVKVVGESRILEFQVHSAHPRLSMMGVGAMRNAFAKYENQGKKNSQSIAYYQEQIGIVRSQVDSLLSKRSHILQRTGYSEMKEEMRVEAGSLIEAEYKLMEARSERMEIEIQYKGLLAAIQDDPRSFPMGQDESRSSSLVYWRRIVIEHEDTLNELMAVHTLNSIPVVQQQELLKTSIANLQREGEAYTEGVRIKLEGLRSRETMIEELIISYEKRRSEAPDAFYQISMIDAETESMRDLMKSLQGKLGEVRIALQADERVSSIIFLTQPKLMPMLSGGASIMYFLMMAFFAFALGIVVAFVLDLLDHRITTPRDIEEYLHLPIFASIPRTK